MVFKVKLKYVLAVVTALICCVTALGTGVFAAAAQTVKLSASGREAELVMYFPQAAAEEIASMQISLVVSGAEVEFVPDSGLPAKIVESRYHEDTGVLTVYLAGTEALFSENTPLTVGRIKLNGNSGSANISVKEGSIKFVRGSELVTPSGGIEYPNSVTISTGGSAPPPSSNNPPSPPSSSTPPSTKPPASPSTSSDVPSVPGYNEPPESSSSSSSSSSDKTEPVVVPVEPADISALTDAVNRAGGYKRADYTSESYSTLSEALKKAETVLSDNGASQDEVDEALLVLENAIGMLVLANNAPSGTDSNISGGTSSTVSDGSSSSSGSPSATDPEKPSSGSSDNSVSPSNNGEQSGNSSDSSAASGTSRNDSSEAQKSDNTAVMWIVIVMVVLAVAAVALIVAIKFKKK